jgi:hypothetical protein
MQFFLNPHGKVKLIRLALMSFLEIVMPLKDLSRCLQPPGRLIFVSRNLR